MPNIAHLRLPHPDADPERAWLETTTLDLRRLVPGEAAGARDSLSIDADADDGDDVDVAFLEAVLPHRPKQNVPSTPAIETAAALPPLPALPIGSRLLPIGEIESWRTNEASHPLCCASDLGALWSVARAAARDAAARECQKENQNQTSAREGTGVTSASFATKDVTVPKACLEMVPAASAKRRQNALAPVVPFAVVGRLRLARAARPNDETETETDSNRTGLCLEDTTGRVAVASVDLPDARLLGKRVLCVAWTLLIDAADQKKNGGDARRGALLEAARFAPLDAPSVVAVPLPAISNAAVPAPPPPRRGGGFAVRGAVTAVSPLIGLTVPSADGGEKGKGSDARHAFFLVELSGDACASCGVPNDGTENTGAQSVNDANDANDAWRRRLVFTGDALARWRPFFGAAMGGEYGASGASGSDATRPGRCGCVLVANLRASRLFKGEGDRRELRVAAATAATTVTPAPVCARDDEGAMFSSRRDFFVSAGKSEPRTNPETAERGCSCASCARGDTVSRLDVHVLSEDPSGLGVRVSGRRDGCGVPFLLTHAHIGSPRRDGVTFPALRPGCLVRVTHAHPVWRRGADEESVDEDEPDETDETDETDEDDMVSEEEPREPRTKVKVRNDETDHFGLRALGACVRTRVRVLRRSPLAAFAPRLFAAEDAVSSRSRSSFFRASLASARATQRHCETRSFVDTAHTRRLALALARRTRTTDANDGRDDQTRPNAFSDFSDFSDGERRFRFRSSDGDDGNARAARAAFAGLLLGKRKRHGGENLIAGKEHDSTSFRRRELPETKQFHDALAAAFSERDFEDERPRDSARSPATTETKTETETKTKTENPESARASIYHEFFAPISLGGLEARVPRLPAVSAVLREASRAFAEASAAKKTRRVAARADGTAPARGTETETETERNERVPFGASVGAARCDRLVVSGAALFAKRREPSRDPSREAPPPKPPKPVALVGWLAHRARDAGARHALELSDAPFASSAGDSARRARGGRVHVEIEDASVSVAETLPLGVLVVLRRWTVFCEGASLCVTDDPDPKPAPCRVHVRVRREDLAVIGAAAPGGFGEHALAPPPPATCGVSDVLVWSPDRSPLGGDAPPPEPGPGGVPLALSRGATAPPPGAGWEPPPRANIYPISQNSRPPAPWFPPPFLARVTRDERILDDRGGERKLRLTLADTTNAHDVVDAYVGGMDPRFVPPGVGGGAVVLVSRAAAHVSASANVYLKLTSRTVLRVIAPAASTLELTRLSGLSSFFENEQKPRGPEASRKRFATLDALARGAAAGFALGRVDRRRWTTRARVARVSFLCAKWACLSCGCDAGSFGAADAAAAMRLVARRKAERSKIGGAKDDKNKNDASSDDDVFARQTFPFPPSDVSVAGCAACRPPAERFRDDAALARAVDAACGFEVEVGAVLTNGEAAADCWVAGGAGKAALPGWVRAATRALAKKHGRVVARFDAAAAAAGSPSPYATEGYCGRALGETERAPLLAAVGHAASLGEVLATVEYKYGAFLNDETTERGGVAALSSPGPVTRLMSLGGVPVATAVAPTAKLRATALEPVEPAREAARMLAEAETTSEK